MTQTTATPQTWTVTVVGDNSVTAMYAHYINRSKAIAAAIDFDYNAMLDAFYNASGERTTEHNVGYVAYFSGVKRAELTSDNMRKGFDEAHGSMLWSAALEDDYRNEPGFSESGRCF